MQDLIDQYRTEIKRLEALRKEYLERNDYWRSAYLYGMIHDMHYALGLMIAGYKPAHERMNDYVTRGDHMTIIPITH